MPNFPEPDNNKQIAIPKIAGSFHIAGPFVKSNPNMTIAPRRIIIWNNAAGLVRKPANTKIPETNSRIPIVSYMLAEIAGSIPAIFCRVIPNPNGLVIFP